MNWPEAIVLSAAILGPCAVVCATILSKRPVCGSTPQEERKKMPGLRAPGEYRVSYTPARRERRKKKEGRA